MSDPITGAANALSAALDTAYGLSRTRAAEGTPVLEPAGDVVGIGDGTAGLLATYDGVVVRITVAPARPEERAAVLGSQA